jgi:hypothetical protein
MAVPATPPPAGRPATEASFKPGRGGARAGAGRPRGVPNKVTQTFRDGAPPEVPSWAAYEDRGAVFIGFTLGSFRRSRSRLNASVAKLIRID